MVFMISPREVVRGAGADAIGPMLGWVGRPVNGTRGDPHGVVSSLAGRLEDATDPDDQLMHVARSVALAFASPYVAVQVDQPDGRHLVASHGDQRRR